jgi:hypothetical protein
MKLRLFPMQAVPLVCLGLLTALGQTPAVLLNVNFGTDAGLVKTGPAAIGQPGDLWNLYSRDDGAGGFRHFGQLNNLKWADGSPSPVHLTVTNAPGAWPSDLADPMMAQWLYPLPNGNGNIRLWLHQVPAGHYDLYLYGHGNLDDLVGVYEVAVLEQSQGTKSVTVGSGWRTDTLQENVHYVVFRDVPSDGTRPVVVTVKPSPHGEAVLNGLQLVQRDSLPPVAGGSVVVPSQFADLEDDAYGASFCTPPTLRLQEVYRSSHFRGRKVTIKAIGFRRNYGIAAFSGALPNLRITLSTTARQPGGLDSSFAANLGSDAVEVFSGPITLTSSATGPAGGPSPFDMVIPLSRSFVYDPTAGNFFGRDTLLRGDSRRVQRRLRQRR